VCRAKYGMCGDGCGCSPTLCSNRVSPDAITDVRKRAPRVHRRGLKRMRSVFTAEDDSSEGDGSGCDGGFDGGESGGIGSAGEGCEGSGGICLGGGAGSGKATPAQELHPVRIPLDATVSLAACARTAHPTPPHTTPHHPLMSLRPHVCRGTAGRWHAAAA
jgi:hypothetical protein